MSPATVVTLVDERRALRRQLLAQRAEIAQRLGPVSGSPGGFPRSMTARFLVQRPDLAVRLVVRIAAMFRSR